MRKISFHKLSDKSFHGKVFMKINFAYLCRVIGEFAEGMTTLIVFTVSSPKNLATAIAVAFYCTNHSFLFAQVCFRISSIINRPIITHAKYMNKSKKAAIQSRIDVSIRNPP